MATLHTDYKLSTDLFKHINDLYAESANRYQCASLSDLDFAQFGILRCLSSACSGHEFLQELADKNIRTQESLSVDLFFKALKSDRRLKNLTSLNDLLRLPVSTQIEDPFAQYEELANWDLYAVDGHYQKAACHDPIFTNRKGENVHVATGHFFRLNLRNHHMSLLATMQPDYKMGKKKEHDAKIIQRSTSDELRYQAPTGRQVLQVWDKACIDYTSWHRLKYNAGVYFLTQEKSNSAAATMSGDLCDHQDPRNHGIIREELVGVAGATMRRIIYENPQDGKGYTYLTNELTLPAYLLVTFYKHRWDIEKIYYQFKTKFNERKSWATSTTAKKAHAIFECLLHNLLLLFEEKLRQEKGLHDEMSEKTAQGRKRPKPIGYINQIVQRATHRSVRFIRWLRNHLFQQSSLSQALARLKTLYTQQI